MEDPLRQSGAEPGLELIETLLWQGHGAPHWPLHLARLQASALRLGWARPAPPPPEAALDLPPEPRRLRLTLDATGALRWTHAPLMAGKPLWQVVISPVRLNSADPWLSVKSTRRAAHDQARAALPEGIDEALMLNERGEVCEGAITNVFFDRGNGMRTPPLSSGLLPGVLRQSLACPEEVLRAEDLQGLRKLWVGNALRGLIPARLVSDVSGG